MTHRRFLLHFKSCLLRLMTFDQIDVECLSHEPTENIPEPSHQTEPLTLKDQIINGLHDALPPLFPLFMCCVYPVECFF